MPLTTVQNAEVKLTGLYLDAHSVYPFFNSREDSQSEERVRWTWREIDWRFRIMMVRWSEQMGVRRHLCEGVHTCLGAGEGVARRSSFFIRVKPKQLPEDIVLIELDWVKPHRSACLWWISIKQHRIGHCLHDGISGHRVFVNTFTGRPLLQCFWNVTIVCFKVNYWIFARPPLRSCPGIRHNLHATSAV